MKTYVVASTGKNAGKTSIIYGLSQVLGNSGYIKPFGDRMTYEQKKIWDHDAALMSSVLDSDSEKTLGFFHSKLKYMCDEVKLKKKLHDLARAEGKGKDILFVEAGCDLAFASSVHLDALSMARSLDAGVILVSDGDEYNILDNLLFLKEYLEDEKVRLCGVLVNKVRDVESFKENHLPELLEAEIGVYGVIPYRAELGYMTPAFISEHILSKTLAGKDGMDRVVKNVFVADMASENALKNPEFQHENKLVITSGDRTDTILLALESNTSCVMLSNGIHPASKVISRADDCGIPLLLSPCDSHHLAFHFQKLDPILSFRDSEKLSLAESLVRGHVDVEGLFEQC